MTNLITEARELCEKATPGEWKVKLHNEDYGQGYGETTYYIDMEDRLLKIGLADSPEKCAKHNTLATFIARSRTLIPELCDALEKAEAEAKALNDCNQKLAEQNRRLIWRNWIPITEGLPEERQHENGEPIEFNVIISGAKVPTTLCFDGAEWRDFWKDGGYGPAYAVTHWMPLPEPPEEGGTT